MRSALDKPEVVDQFSAKEVGLKTVLDQVVASSLPSVTVSNFGVIPKPRQPGKSFWTSFNQE